MSDAKGIRFEMEACFARLDQMVTNARPEAIRGFFMRIILPLYKNAQRERWMSENASEGEQWMQLTSEAYAKRKKKIAAEKSYPGGGTKLMILSGALVGAATGDGPGLYAIASGTQFTIGIDIGQVDYAGYASEKRPTMKFSDETIASWTEPLSKFIFGGEK